MHSIQRWTLPFLGLGALAATGCDGANRLNDYNPEYKVAALEASLTKTETCEDLLDGFQADALAKIEITTEEMIRYYVFGEQYGGGRGGFGGVAEDTAEAGNNSAAPQAPTHYSETNTQVAGVDEADIVKTDGYHIYVLSGSKLVVLKSWPADETALERAIDIEGYTHEMFVENARAVVFSSVANPAFNRPKDCTDQSYDSRCYDPRTFTKVTVVDAIDGSPSVERELYFEGWYNTSRRHDNIVRSVISNWNDYYYWEIPQVWQYLDDINWGYNPDGTISFSARGKILERVLAWRTDAIAAVKATELADWVPRRYEMVSDTLTELAPNCGGFYLNGPGLVDYGMTQVIGFDLDKPSKAPTQNAIQGYTSNVFANGDTLVLDQWDYSAWYRAYEDDADSYSSSSILHRFDLSAEGGGVTYVGSGVLPGTIVDQFSLDEKDGVIRAATTQNTWSTDWNDWWSKQANFVVTLEASKGKLNIVGSTPALAEDESIQSVRFIDDMAYVVTFRQVDPLFAIDVSDKTKPTVLGELKIPGFSTYMHPLDKTHLLTIGYDADEETGQTEGMQVQIFDVTDPTKPTRTHQYSLGGDWGYSEANWNHKAFTYYDHLGMLAFPYSSWSGDWNTYRSSLELFHVDAEDGIDKVGSIDHSALIKGFCSQLEEDWERDWCRQSYAELRRGVFVEDYVYSLSYAGVQVHALSDVNTKVAEVTLPTDGLRSYYYGWGWGGRGWAL
ncbi:MAG: beta-propeller domain-containing protein [Polyangiales bacterium]